MAACRSCGAEIFWAFTEKGRRIPVNKQPHPDGNLEIVPRGGPGNVHVRYVTDDGETLPGLDLPERFVSRFATCPHAAHHRKADR